MPYACQKLRRPIERESEMRINTKCSLALHLLLLLAAFSGESKMTSEKIAKSAGCNPVIIRNLLGDLKKAGLVNVQRGTGGATLGRAPEEISIWSVCEAVDPDSLTNLIGMHQNPSQACPVGSKIHELLKAPYESIEKAVQEAMSAFTLDKLMKEYENNS
jgi:Rrf2 family protein